MHSLADALGLTTRESAAREKVAAVLRAHIEKRASIGSSIAGMLMPGPTRGAAMSGILGALGGALAGGGARIMKNRSILSQLPGSAERAALIARAGAKDAPASALRDLAMIRAHGNALPMMLPNGKLSWAGIRSQMAAHAPTVLRGAGAGALAGAGVLGGGKVGLNMLRRAQMAAKIDKAMPYVGLGAAGLLGMKALSD